MPAASASYVHEGFDRENISVSSQRSERSVSYRRIEEEMVSNLLPWQFIKRHRIAIPHLRTAEEYVAGAI